MKSFRELREKTLTPAEKKKREEIAKAIEKDNPDMPMDKKMAIATATAKRVAEKSEQICEKCGKVHEGQCSELDEGRMKELHGYIERGMSAQQIAKKMKLDVKTIQSLMPKKESVNEIRQPLTVPKSLAKYVVYKKTGIGKIKQVAHLRAMPKGKELDRVLDKYDADGVIAMSKIKRNKMTVEAVDADDTGGEEEVNMAMKQVQAMRHFLDGIESRVKEQGDMEEWYQNKLTKANDYLKTLYSYGKGDKVQEAVTEAKGKYASDAQMDDFLKGMEKHPDVKKMSKHYNRPVGDIVKALRARVSVNRWKHGNEYALNFTDKDSKLKVKYKKRYAPMKEAVSPAQQAAIAIAKKEKGEKPKEESRAYRDAMRGMKGNTKGMATTKKDKDIEATDDDRKAASKNIIMQLRKAADLPKGAEVEFERGKGKVTRDQAKSVIARFNSLPKPRDREQMQKSIKSLADIKKILGR